MRIYLNSIETYFYVSYERKDENIIFDDYQDYIKIDNDNNRNDNDITGRLINVINNNEIYDLRKGSLSKLSIIPTAIWIHSIKKEIKMQKK